MNSNMPRSPFSTPLSGSARETEIRLRNIFSGPKKRPPLLLIMLTVLVILLCGNLVAFRQLPAEPSIVMETQYYDSYGNYVEIPALALPAGEKNEAVDAINEAINDLRLAYSDLDTRTGGDAWDNRCLFYPSTTDRYLNLLFFLTQFTTDLNTGHVFSMVYDLKEGTLVSAEDALALTGLNEKGLLDQVTKQVQPQIDREYQEYDFRLALHNLTLEGFRIRANGQPVFYLTGRVDDVDDAVNDAVSGADVLYIWENRVVEEYAQYSGEPVPLVPAEETDKLDPPLWNQWYFSGGELEGGYSPAPVSSQTVADLRAVLLGDMMFTDADTGLVLDVSRVTDAVTSNASFTAKPARFTYLDLDGDGTNEAVLWLETEEGDPTLAFLILRWQGEGRVFGYLRFPRWLENLKQDGTHFYSLSAFEYGVNLVRFIYSGEGGPEVWETETLLRQEWADSNQDRLAWFYGEDPVSEADFNVLYQEQTSKEDAVWHDFTPENIEQVIF